MKKHFLIASIFAGLLLSVFFVSCEKDNSTLTNDTKNSKDVPFVTCT
jgi:hypothetical protein